MSATKFHSHTKQQARLLVDSIWKIDNDYKGTKSCVLSSSLKPVLNVFIKVANTTILKMVIYVGYMHVNQLYLKIPWNIPWSLGACNSQVWNNWFTSLSGILFSFPTVI